MVIVMLMAKQKPMLMQMDLRKPMVTVNEIQTHLVIKRRKERAKDFG